MSPSEAQNEIARLQSALREAADALETGARQTKMLHRLAANTMQAAACKALDAATPRAIEKGGQDGS